MINERIKYLKNKLENENNCNITNSENNDELQWLEQLKEKLIQSKHCDEEYHDALVDELLGDNNE